MYPLFYANHMSALNRYQPPVAPPGGLTQALQYPLFLLSVDQDVRSPQPLQ